MPLSEQHRAKLDGIVQQMTANKESDETIQTVVNDFKQKYGGAESGTPMGKPQDAFEKAVNYHTGNTLIDAPLKRIRSPKALDREPASFWSKRRSSRLLPGRSRKD
jgi:hypothetical protein